MADEQPQQPQQPQLLGRAGLGPELWLRHPSPQGSGNPPGIEEMFLCLLRGCVCTLWRARGQVARAWPALKKRPFPWGR